MPKFKYQHGGSEANWTENLYHRSLPVINGVCETDDDLDIDALLHLGWELLPEDSDPPSKSSRSKTAHD